MKKLKLLLSVALFAALATGSVSCEKSTKVYPIGLDTERLEFRHQGETKTVSVESKVPWEASSEQDWIEIVDREDGTGFDVVVGANEEGAVEPAEREGTIVVSNGSGEDRVIAVWQALAVKAVNMYPHTATVVFPGGTMQLEAMVFPANATNKKVNWESDDTSIVTVDENGILTAVAIGKTKVTMTSEDVDVYGEHFFDECNVIVASAWTPGEVTFRSDRTWIVGDQEWSDVVLASNAEKDTYTGVTGETYIPDAMRNGAFGHMFSWAAVDQFAAELCPEPWHAPSTEEFVALDLALGGTGENFQPTNGLEDKYREQWGLEWVGQAFNSMISGGGIDNGGANDVANGAGYWATNDKGGVMGAALRVVDNDLFATPHPNIMPDASIIKQYGFLVRCVKAK